MNADQLLAESFKPLLGVPCWGVNNGYGSWLTFQFGAPHLSIREPVPDAPHEIMRQRSVQVKGQHQLWVEMARWIIFQDGERLAHEESDSNAIRRAAAWMAGQALIDLRHSLSPITSEFTFDLGGRLWLSRYAEWSSDHGLWHLTSGDIIVSLQADGQVSCDRSAGEKRILQNYGYIKL